MRLKDDPAVHQLARDLGLPRRGNPLTRIRGFALDRVQQILTDSPVAVTNLESLRLVLADNFRLRIEFLSEDSDIERVARQHADFHPLLAPRLREEFLNGETEGITLERSKWDPARFGYLAVVDARGSRASRAFFTAFHEITHLIIHPEQMAFPGFRRTPGTDEKTRDPIESVVDHVAGQVGFFAPVFGPLLDDAIRQEGGVTFGCLDSVRLSTSPPPSLHATAIAAVNLVSKSAMFVHADLACKKAEARALRSSQTTFGFAKVKPKFDVRAVAAVSNDAAKRKGLIIHPHIRIPRRSVIYDAFESSEEVELRAREDQAWWENSRNGSLPPLPFGCADHPPGAIRLRFDTALLELVDLRAVTAKTGPTRRVGARLPSWH